MPGSPRSAALLFAALCGCNLIARFPAQPDADADTDADTDADADSESDADRDADADRDGESADVEIDATGSVLSVSFEGFIPETAAMATSFVVQPELTCGGGSPENLLIVLRANGGLVSGADWPGLGSTFGLRVSAGCGVDPVRVSFPIAAAPYDVTFDWSVASPLDWTSIDDATIHVDSLGVRSEDFLADEPTVTVTLPPGLRAETVFTLAPCTSEAFDGVVNEPASIAMTDGTLGSVLVFACRTEAWFHRYGDPAPMTSYQRLRPDDEDGDGPDQISELVYVPASIGGGEDRLLAAAGGTDDAGGGIFQLLSDVEEMRVERLLAAPRASAIAAVADHATFADGLYFSNDGFIDHLTIGAEGGYTRNPWSETPGYRPYAVSIAVGRFEDYSTLSMFAVSCADDDDNSCDEMRDLHRVDSTGSGSVFGRVSWAFPPQLEASAGGIFGRLVYVIDGNRVAFVHPDGYQGLRDSILQTDGVSLIDGTVYAPQAWIDHYPPGFYFVANGNGGLRVLRIVQDLGSD